MTILSYMYLWTWKSILNFRSHPDPDMDSESGTDSPCRRSGLVSLLTYSISVSVLIVKTVIGYI